MADVAFIGTGLLGSAMVEGMLKRGDSVTVWNRTESKARALEAAGARVASSPADAVAGAERVHLTLSERDAGPAPPHAEQDELTVRVMRGGIRARGSHQREYLSQIRSRDLTFGIGPRARAKRISPWPWLPLP